MTAAEQYTTELGEQLQFNATWTPGMPLALGAIGTINSENIFVPVSSLRDLGITFEESAPPAGATETFDYATAGAVEIGLKLKGEPSALTPSLPISAAGLGIKFKRQYATVFRAEEATHWRIADELALAEEVISLARDKRWDKDWCFITQLVRAKTTTALVSDSASAGIEFRLSADVTAGGI